MLETLPTGYALRIDPDELDAARFERLAHAARDLLEEDPARAADLLRGALALWRGRPFADVLHQDAVASEVAPTRRASPDRAGDASGRRLSARARGELVPDLEALVAEHPFREHLRAQLMLALYRAGRHADALAAYRQARQTAVEELGIDPQRAASASSTGGCSDTIPRSCQAGLLPAPRARSGSSSRSCLPTSRVLAAGDELLDPEDIRAVLRPLLRPHSLGARALRRHGREVHRRRSVALFGAPRAHEDDPERAVRAALTIRDWLAEQNGRHVRIGRRDRRGPRHARRAPRTRESRWPWAMSSTAAARLEMAAPADGVLVDEQTFRATRHAIEYREAAPVDSAGGRRPDQGVGGDPPLAGPGVDPLAAPPRRSSAASASSPPCASGSPGRRRTLAAARHDPGRPRDRQDAPRLRVATSGHAVAARR